MSDTDTMEEVYRNDAEKDLVPTPEELVQLTDRFRSECPSGFEKAKDQLQSAEGLVPRNNYQYNGISLSPIITGYSKDKDGSVINIGSISGVYAPNGKEPWTEEEKAAIKKLAEENKQYAFRQREV